MSASSFLKKALSVLATIVGILLLLIILGIPKALKNKNRDYSNYKPSVTPKSLVFDTPSDNWNNDK